MGNRTGEINSVIQTTYESFLGKYHGEKTILMDISYLWGRNLMKKTCLILLLNFMMLMAFQGVAAAYDEPICGLGAERLYNKIRLNSVNEQYKVSRLLNRDDVYIFRVSMSQGYMYPGICINTEGYVTAIIIDGTCVSEQSKADLNKFVNICLKSIGLSKSERLYLEKNLEVNEGYDEKRGAFYKHYFSVYVSSTHKTIEYSAYYFLTGQTLIFINARE